jgi:hypothetical protein
MPPPTHDALSRDYCFVIMSYQPRFDAVFDALREVIEGRTGLEVVRADRRPAAGQDLHGKVLAMIERASVIVAELSEASPNVYYEYGHATALGRQPIPIAEEGVKLPTDVIGQEVPRYRGSALTDKAFADLLVHNIAERLHSPVPQLRRMLASPHPFPAYVLAAPKAEGPDRQPNFWHPPEERTFGDWLGVAGIVSAFGNLFGAARIPQVLHAQRVHRSLRKQVATYYCIGSPKVNLWSAHWLERLQRGFTPQWTMDLVAPPPAGTRPVNPADRRTVIRGGPALGVDLAAPIPPDADPVEDYGLIVRGPHPEDARHLVLVVAGRHSLGTHAACAFVTQREGILQLETHLALSKIDLGRSTQPFWALVRGRARRDGASEPEVELVEAGGYAPDKGKKRAAPAPRQGP